MSPNFVAIQALLDLIYGVFEFLSFWFCEFLIFYFLYSVYMNLFFFLKSIKLLLLGIYLFLYPCDFFQKILRKDILNRLMKLLDLF